MAQGLDDPVTHDVLDDRLTGSVSDDHMVNRSGNDVVDGGSGRDTLEYAGSRSQYTVTRTATGVLVDDHGGLGARDDVRNVERLQFADDKLALDVDGNAGTVAKVLGAVFGRESIHDHPDFVGIGLKLADGGMSYEALMQLAISARLGHGADDHGAVVDLLYTNVVGTAPRAEDRAAFVKLLDDHSFSVGSLGVLAADTSLNQSHINLVGLAQTGIDYIG